jgi:hypothetical protein
MSDTLEGQKAPLGERRRVAAALRFMPAAIIATRRASSARRNVSRLTCGARVAAVGFIRQVVVLWLMGTPKSSPKARPESSATTRDCVPPRSEGTSSSHARR